MENYLKLVNNTNEADLLENSDFPPQHIHIVDEASLRTKENCFLNPYIEIKTVLSDEYSTRNVELYNNEYNTLVRMVTIDGEEIHPQTSQVSSTQGSYTLTDEIKHFYFSPSEYENGTEHIVRIYLTSNTYPRQMFWYLGGFYMLADKDVTYHCAMAEIEIIA